MKFVLEEKQNDFKHPHHPIFMLRRNARSLGFWLVIFGALAGFGVPAVVQASSITAYVGAAGILSLFAGILLYFTNA